MSSLDEHDWGGHELVAEGRSWRCRTCQILFSQVLDLPQCPGPGWWEECID